MKPILGLTASHQRAAQLSKNPTWISQHGHYTADNPEFDFLSGHSMKPNDPEVLTFEVDNCFVLIFHTFGRPLKILVCFGWDLVVLARMSSYSMFNIFFLQGFISAGHMWLSRDDRA